MNKEFMQKKIDKISKSYKKNKEIPLRILTVICACSLIFFLSSNFIFNKNEVTISTELNQIYTLDSVDFSITKRQYNPNTRLIEVSFKMENKSISKLKNYNFEVREKQDPNKIVESKVIQVDNENYVLITNVSKRWGAISISIKDESINDKTLKLYLDSIDIEKNNDLVELDDKGYLIDLCKDNIKNIETEIEDIKTEISFKYDEILALTNSNSSLKEGKRYEIESEQLKTDGKIEGNNSTIKKLKSEIKKMEDNIKENNKKIDKLNERIKEI